MKALCKTLNKHEVQLTDVTSPRIVNPTDVLVKIKEAGICGTDTAICNDVHGEGPKGEPRLILGHEACGEVVSIGTSVRSLCVGQLVVPSVRRPCNNKTCVYCRSGEPDMCASGEYTERGIKGLHGFMTQYIVESEQYLHPVSRDISDFAVLTEPLTIAEKGLRQVAAFRAARLGRSFTHMEAVANLKVIVIGSGPTGILAAMLSRLHGFSTTILSRSRPNTTKASLAKQLGCKYYALEEHTPESLLSICGQFDVVYEAAGKSETAFDTLQWLLASNGCYVLTGIPDSNDSPSIRIAGDQIMRDVVLENKLVFGTVNAGAKDFESAIRNIGEFLKKWPDVCNSLITSRTPLSEIGIEHLVGSNGIKNLITVEE